MVNQRPVDPEISVPEVPAPWKLKGRGYMLLYRFGPEGAEEDPFLPERMRRGYQGGRAALMAVDYESSDAGPYRELLFIPGRVDYGGSPFTISRIYVSTWDSVINGRRNWGIPKDRADFSWQEAGPRREAVTVMDEGRPVFSARFQRGGLPFPVHTALMPFPLVQETAADPLADPPGQNPAEALYTRFSGRGWGRLVKVQDLQVNPELFPALAGRRPKLAVRIEPFQITFPTARQGKPLPER